MDAVGHNADAVGHNADAVGHNADAVGHNADAVGHNPDAVGHNPDAVPVKAHRKRCVQSSISRQVIKAMPAHTVKVRRRVIACTKSGLGIPGHSQTGSGRRCPAAPFCHHQCYTSCLPAQQRSITATVQRYWTTNNRQTGQNQGFPPPARYNECICIAPFLPSIAPPPPHPPSALRRVGSPVRHIRTQASKRGSLVMFNP